MKIKYLSLALATVLATSLTACGSDSDSSSNSGDHDTSVPAPAPIDSDGDGVSDADEVIRGTDPNKADTDGDGVNDDLDKAPTDPNYSGVDTDKDDDKDDTGSGTPDPEDNTGDASETQTGDITKKSSVVGQNYIRGTSALFDRHPSTNGDPANNGNATVLGFVDLQNKAMTNIVVAQYLDTSSTDASGKNNVVKEILGAAPDANPSNVTDAGSIQENNATDLTVVDDWKNGIVTVDRAQSNGLAATYTVSNHETKLANRNGVTQISNADPNNNKARVFGALYNQVAHTDTTENSLKFDDFTEYGGNNPAFADRAEKITLNNVQYGRVTGNLGDHSAGDIKGLDYVRSKFADKKFGGNTTETDVYFYRGINQTTLDEMPTTGKFDYYGHALMYGIDNTHGGVEGNGQSNSVGYGGTGQAMGNFVHANVDFGAEKEQVQGSIYNVWDDAPDKPRPVHLVEFTGTITGNTFKGDAKRTYAEGNAKVKGSFFGDKAEEMGGNINSIEKGYGKSEWGGVFGAKATDTASNGGGLPPINAVE